MNLKIIAAIGINNELGYKNNLIWHLPNDLKFFKEQTRSSHMLMGKNTFLSLPGILPGRHHIVLDDTNELNNEQIEIFTSIPNFLEAYKDYRDPIYVIGGASIYEQFIPYANELILTEINASTEECDTYFYKFDKNNYTKKFIKKGEDNGITYNHVVYTKNK